MAGTFNMKSAANPDGILPPLDARPGFYVWQGIWSVMTAPWSFPMAMRIAPLL